MRRPSGQPHPGNIPHHGLSHQPRFRRFPRRCRNRGNFRHSGRPDRNL